MNPMLKAPGSIPLRIGNDGPPSNVDVNSNLRRCTKAENAAAAKAFQAKAEAAKAEEKAAAEAAKEEAAAADKVRQCRLTASKPMLKAHMVSALGTLIS